MANNLVTKIHFRSIVASFTQDEFMTLVSSICTECGFTFLRQIIFNGLQHTSDPSMESNMQLIMELISQISSASSHSISSPLQHKNNLRLNDLSPISISKICGYLDFADLLQFERTDRYIFVEAHQSISCVSLLNTPDWFNKYLAFHYKTYKKTKRLDLSRFNHVTSLPFILDDNHAGSIMYNAKEIARRHHWSYSVDEFQQYCHYIGYALQKLSKLHPVYFKCTLHFDWGIKNIRCHFPFQHTWIHSVKHMAMQNMSWNHILRFLELQFDHLNDAKVSTVQRIPLNAITFENIWWESCYLNHPRKYFGYFLDLLFNFETYVASENSSDRSEALATSNYAKLYGLTEHVFLNGKLVQLLHFSMSSQKWKCKRVSPRIGYNGTIHHYMSIEASHLRPIPNHIQSYSNYSGKDTQVAQIQKLVFINMSLHNMITDDSMRSTRQHMFDLFDDVWIVNKYLSPSLRYLVFHSNSNDALFGHLVQTIITARSSTLSSLHLQTIKGNSIMFDVLPFQSFDNLRELCIESTENTSYLLERIAVSMVAFERLHMCIKSGLRGDDVQSKVHKNAVTSLLKAVFSEFNQNSLQLLSFDMDFQFDAMDFQSAYFNSVDYKLNQLQLLYEILNSCLVSVHQHSLGISRPLKIKINLKYGIEMENNYLTSSKRKQLMDVIREKLNYFPMLFYELCTALLSIR
eukprot:1038993_1